MPIDVSQIHYRLTAIRQDGSQVPLTKPALVSLTWEEQHGELSQRINARLQDMLLPDGTWLHDAVVMGGHVLLTADWGEGYQTIMDGIIFTWDYADSGNPTVTITAYDNLYYLTASEDDILLLGNYPIADGIKDIFKAWGIPMGQFELGAGADVSQLKGGAASQDTGAGGSAGDTGGDGGDGGDSVPTASDVGTDANPTIPNIRLKGKLGDIITQLLTEAFHRTQQEWILRWDAAAGVATVTMPGSNTPIYQVSGSTNLGSFQDTQNISQLVTEVKIASSQRPVMADDQIPSDDVTDGVTPLTPIQAQFVYRQSDTGEATSDTAGTTLLQFGRIRRVVQAASTQSPQDLTQYAQDLLDEYGAPDRTQRFTCPDIPFLRRGDAIAVYAGTLSGVSLIGGISHSADNRTMDITIESRGTFAHRLKAPNPGVKTMLTDDEVDPGDLSGVRSQGGTDDSLDTMPYEGGGE